MADEIPEWARRRAYQLTEGADGLPSDPRGWAQKADRIRGAFARYIAENEEPPVDPLLIEAREIVKATFDPGSHSRCDCREKIDAGKMDGGHRIRATLAALKRGMELAREANHG